MCHALDEGQHLCLGIINFSVHQAPSLSGGPNALLRACRRKNAGRNETDPLLFRQLGLQDNDPLLGQIGFRESIFAWEGRK
jgi:hypothetical protein